MMMDPKDYNEEEEEENVEAMDILEECWFFNNLLINNNNSTRKSSPRKKKAIMVNMMMPRFNSDIPSHEYQLVKNVKKKEEDLNERIRSKVILRQPSDPTVLLQAAANNNNEADDDFALMKEVNNKKIDEEINGRRRTKLLRTPSLPPSIGREDQIHIFPQNQITSKSYSTPRSGTCRNTDQGERIINNTKGIKEMRRRYLINQRRMRKSLSDLEFEEVQGFKDLGFSFEKERINPSVANILPGLQEKNREETEEDKAIRRPYLSEAWLVQSYKFLSPPPIPNCASSDHKSSKDMKEHIKFWAKVVASNVHQEC